MSGIAVASHISCAIAFSVVTFVLMRHRPTRAQFPLLIFTSLFTFCWAVLSASFAANWIEHYCVIVATEVVCDAFWLATLIQILTLTQRVEKTRWYFRPVFYVFIVGLLIALTLNAILLDLGYLEAKSFEFARASFVGYITFSVVILALIEQIYRGTVLERRPAIRGLCIGVGFMYSYEFYMYANALIFEGISAPIWEVRGAIMATIAPLIGFSALSHEKWQAHILPSRAVIFRSTVFVSSSIYLACMAVVGFYMRGLHEQWGHAFQILFFTGSLIVLALMLSSVRMRSWTKLFLAQNFFKLRYDYRDEWLKFSRLLSANDDSRPIWARSIIALANMVESPKGALFEWEENQGYVLKECWNDSLPSKDVIIEEGEFTEYVKRAKKALELPYSKKGELRKKIAIPKALSEFNWAWLVVPLFHGKRLHAFVILAHPKAPFFSVNWEVLDLLSMAGHQVAICLVQEQHSQALGIARQFEEYNRFAAFVLHDLKNVSAQLKLIQSNIKKHGDKPEFIESVYRTIGHVSGKVDRLLLQMHPCHNEKKLETVSIDKILKKVILLTRHCQPIATLRWKDDSDDLLVMGLEDKLVNILCHLIENAQQATPPDGEVVLSVTSENEQLQLCISDTGCGMDPEFIPRHLYKPFSSTKGNKGMGIGVFEARETIQNLNGTLRVETIKNVGTVFTMTLPILERVTKSVLLEEAT